MQKHISENSIGRNGKHNQFCEGHVSCPNTGKEECGKVVNWKILQLKNGTVIEEVATIFCFGCGELHSVEEK